MKKEEKMLTQERLKELLDYDEHTGIFTWKISRNKSIAGSNAGALRNDNRIHIGIDYKRYKAHRLAFLFMTGRFPKECIDHINGDPSDNRWVNLREASHQENRMNINISSMNTSGFKGVSIQKGERKYKAQGHAYGKFYYLGYFDTADEASIEYNKFAKKHHGEFYRDTQK